ncbi:MAG: lytic transglycosylase domain-containing protein, partial [Bdellovibrionaceae bacterium]|nr:lytic transglycosylase domain-containing protein [Pseudobdellovibrionaceae bacterium]
KEDKLRIDIKGKLKVPDIKNLRLYYNSTDLTELFLKNSVQKVYPNEKWIRIEFDALKLSAKQLHNISFLYADDLRHYAYNYSEPSCSIYQMQPAKGLHGFSTPVEYLGLVNLSGREEKINSSLIAGLVAMESGFNPAAVSSAKALGLTQITDIAVQQINKKTSHWPRRDLSSVSYAQVKEQITAGELTHEFDWRLEPGLSLKGGASYLKYIIHFWNLKENKKILNGAGIFTDEQTTDIILASYNSGPERIKKFVLKNKKNWLNEPDLKNVRYYISMIYSYCNEFSEGPKI